MSHSPGSLVIFSDDWGRHPSSCQHLVRHLLPRLPALWVNTIGTRFPGLSLDDLRKAATKLRQWFGPGCRTEGELPPNLQVISPRMWPGFRRAWQRRLNARQIARAVARQAGPALPAPRVVLTSLPITADLVGRFPADRWVYYCADDMSVWPGLDGSVMRAMEEQLIRRVDALIAVSEPLRQRLSALSDKPVHLLTHGIDLAHWTAPPAQSSPPAPLVSPAGLPPWWATLRRPIFLFWGLVDARLDTAWCRALAEQGGGTLVLVGPEQSPDPALRAMAGGPNARLVLPGPAPYAQLPSLARAADVLVMPYADLPVTQAMQPLKFKEYLAAGYPQQFKPVVVRDLPATRPLAHAADVVATADAFVARVRARAAQGVPPDQAAARAALADESWDRKAAELEKVLCGEC